MSSERELVRFVVKRPRIPESSSQNENSIIRDDLVSLPPYIYKRLKAKSSRIRIISLHPSPSFSAIPEVTIHHLNLSTRTDQQYEALSYTWGSPDDPEMIIVRNSVSSFQKVFTSRSLGEICTLSVTRNLDEALRYLRLKDKERFFWIDAICINQQDNVEKSHQVRRMADVYTQASRVVAWLGPEEIVSGIAGQNEKEPGTTLAIQLLEEMGQNLIWEWGQNPTPATADGIALVNLDVPLPYGEIEMTSLYCLLQKSWFERLWIWQEIRLGNASSILMCGNSTTSWSCFRKVIYLLYLKISRPEVEITNFRDLIFQANRLCFYDNSNTGVPLPYLLLSTAHCKAFDPRDRIFALLSLVNDNDRKLGLKPDYSREIKDIYKEVMFKHINYHQSLNMIERCRLAPEDKRIPMLPTWVPDWSSRESSINLNGLQTHSQFGSGGIQCQYRCIEPDRLVVMGVEVGIIRKIICLDEAQVNLSSDTTTYFIKRLAPVDMLEATYITGETLLNAFTKTLLLNMTTERHDPPDANGMSFAMAQKYIREIILTSMNELPLVTVQDASGKRIRNRIFYHLESLRMFETAEGFIGMAPFQMRAGDRIAMVLGFDCAMILRPTDNGQNYQVVGPCYIHGFMQGEAFLGPLPDSWDRVLFWPSTKGGYPVFINSQSGERRSEDPRLQGPYPEGWIRLSAEDDYQKRYKNLKTGKKTTKDPRLSFEEIQKRSLNLKEFILV